MKVADPDAEDASVSESQPLPAVINSRVRSATIMAPPAGVMSEIASGAAGRESPEIASTHPGDAMKSLKRACGEPTLG